MKRKWIGVWCLGVLLLASNVLAQRVTGSIAGQVRDQQGLAVPGAAVTVTNEAMAVTRSASTGEEGNFAVPDLAPGSYKVTIKAAGFKAFETTVTVRVGIATPVQASLEIGETTTVIEVQSAAVNVDTVVHTVQGVVTSSQIDQLPLNGRNFLDLAQLDPGVQTVDGGNFDPTKNQMVGVSIGGRSGRVTRIQMDGVDLTDETVGTTVANLSNESIQEFGISQSSLDPSTDVTSSGAVNIISRSGSNDFHGSGFFFGRSDKLDADPRLTKVGPEPPFDRENWGGRAGWMLLPDKWFWHVEYEQSSQDGQRITNVPEFPAFTGAFAVPVDETMAAGRTDYVLNDRVKLFYRFIHNHNSGVTGFGGRDLAAFSNINNTNVHVVGGDLTMGRWTHSLRYSFLNFNNGITPANSSAGTPLALNTSGQPDPNGPISLANVLLRIDGRLQDIGPDLLAPQQTFQNNNQTKWDGSVVFGRHTMRFGAEWNRIEQFVFASFFGNAPRIRAAFNSATQAFAATNPFGPGGVQNPLNFPNRQIVLGNGLGFFSEKPALGFPFGGTINHRLGFYVQDSFKWTPNFTLNYGLRYNWHSLLSNHDLIRTPLLGVFDPSLAGRPRRDTDDFAPQAGFAWNVFGNNKTVIRGGAGIFYETNIFNNILFDRVLNIPPGIGNDTPVLSASDPTVKDPATGATLFDFSTDCGTMFGGNCFGAPIGYVIPFAVQAQQIFQQATAVLTAGYPQPGIPPLFDTIRDTAGSVLDTRYETPYATQFNVGVQHEIKPGLVLSVDYIRNEGRHFNLTRDRNRVGAADTLDIGIATAAMNATFAGFGCNTGSMTTDVDCVIANGGSISDFSDNGLGAGSALDGFAFRGMNPNFRTIGIIEPIGISRFQALQVRLRGDVGSFERVGVKRLFVNVTYQLGRFESTGADQDFLSNAGFNDRPTKFFGPANLDRANMIGISFQAEFPFNIHLSSNTRIQTDLASSLFLPLTTGGADEIFFSDLDGDGVTADPLFGTNRGSFERDVKIDELNKVINNFNNSLSGKISPAGQALVDAGLFTSTQLQQLGAVITSVAPAPTNAVGNDSFFTTDVRLSWRYRPAEWITIEPMFEVFNLFNVANYAPLSSSLDGGPGDPNGTTVANRPTRVGQGSGSFAPGGQRSIQFGVRVSW